MSPLVAVIDSDKAVQDLFAPLANDENWVVSGYSYAEATLATIRQLKPELFVLDFAENGMDEAWNFLQLLNMEESTASVPIIITATRSLILLEIESYLASRKINVLAKPFDVEDFSSI